MSNHRENAFETHRQAMLAAASQIYRADLAGEPAHDIVPQIMPVSLGDMSATAIAEAQRAQHEVTVGSRVLARHAQYEDRIAAGGVTRAIARFERGLALFVGGERRYLGNELDSAGLISIIRASR